MSTGEMEGRPTERIVTTENVVMPGTKGGVSCKLTKTKDIEYALPKETRNRPRVYVQDVHLASVNKKKFDEGYAKIDWGRKD